MTKLMPTFVAHDPVVEVFIRHDIDRGGVHQGCPSGLQRYLSENKRLITLMGVNFALRSNYQ